MSATQSTPYPVSASDQLRNDNVTEPNHLVNTQPIRRADSEIDPVELTPEEQLAHLSDARNTLANSSAAGQHGSIVRHALDKLDHVIASMTGRDKVYSSLTPTQRDQEAIDYPAGQRDGGESLAVEDQERERERIRQEQISADSKLTTEGNIAYHPSGGN